LFATDCKLSVVVFVPPVALLLGEGICCEETFPLGEEELLFSATTAPAPAPAATAATTT
jgi:hypothetical protein